MFKFNNRQPKNMVAVVAAGAALGAVFAVASHNHPLLLGLGAALVLTFTRAQIYKGHR